ncbi:MAG: hypothetical protein IPF92_30975 [Myxococcales bacterium]|nr:hypothetical protein [Myxococcales bacterium]
MRILTLALAAAVAMTAAGCTKKQDPPPPPAATPAAPAPAAPAAKSDKGAPGAGDRSGKSIANAMALRPGAPTTLRAACSGAPVYVGPFTFAKSPTKLELRAEVKGTSAAQICRGTAHFVDSAGKRPQTAALPCVQDGKPVTVTIEHEYSPHNGGSDVTPLYWELKNDEKKPEGCDTIDVKLTLP